MMRGSNCWNIIYSLHLPRSFISYHDVELSYKCWTVWSGKLKHPSGSKTSSSVSDEEGRNMRCNSARHKFPQRIILVWLENWLISCLPLLHPVFSSSWYICSGSLVSTLLYKKKKEKKEEVLVYLFFQLRKNTNSRVTPGKVDLCVWARLCRDWQNSGHSDPTENNWLISLQIVFLLYYFHDSSDL